MATNEFENVVSTKLDTINQDLRALSADVRQLGTDVRDLGNRITRLETSETSRVTETERRFGGIEAEAKATAEVVSQIRTDLDQAKGSIALGKFLIGVGGISGLIAFLGGSVGPNGVHFEQPGHAQTEAAQQSEGPINGKELKP